MESSHRNKYPIIRFGIVIIISAIVLRLFIIEFFVVPSDSMHSTLQIGDRVIVAKCRSFVGFPPNIPFVGTTSTPWRFRYTSFDRHDIIVFLHETEEHTQQIYVKRIAAIPGDTIILNDTSLSIRSSTVNSTIHYKGTNTLYKRFEGNFVIPKKGDNIKIDSRMVQTYRQFIESEGTRVDILNDIVYINGNPQNFYTVRNDCYFVLGDNLNNSFDSRYYGFIPENCIVGTPFMVVWSGSEQGIQWQRIGKLIL